MKNKIIKIIQPFLILYYYKKFLKLKKNIDDLLNQELDIICFFPSYNLGGAEKVHIQILKALEKYKVATFIIHKSSNSYLKKDFIIHSDYFIDFNVIGNYVFFRKKLAKLISHRINRIKKKCTLFGCNAEIFYSIIDLIDNSNIRKIDLLHAFSPYAYGIEQRSILSVKHLNKRIVINKKTFEDYKKQYNFYNIDESEVNKIIVIPNTIDLECNRDLKSFDTPLKCLWIGRNSKEKRPWIFFKIAQEIHKDVIPISFSIVGNFENYKNDLLIQKVQFLGEVFEKQELNQIYNQHHILLTTSIFEGFPLTIAEGMCKSLINISTDVGGISEHLKNNETGFLIENNVNEDEIIYQFCKILKMLVTNIKFLNVVSKKANLYAKENFSFENFKRSYIKHLIHE